MFYSDRVLEITKQTYSLVESADLLNVQKPSQADEKEQGDLLHIHKERAENLPDEEKLTKLIADEGFVTAVGSGQFFMTKDTDEFLGCDGHAGCREYTLLRNDGSSTPKGWIRGSTKIGPVLEGTTNYHQGKPGIEIRIDSLSGDGSHSSIRISNGLNKFVKDLTEKARTPGVNDENDSEGTGRPVQQETRIVNHSPTKADKPAAKAKPKPTSAPPSSHSQTSIPIQEREWHDVEPREHKSKYAASFTVTMKMIAFLRHGTLPRDQDGTIELGRLKEEFRSGFPTAVFWPIRV